MARLEIHGATLHEGSSLFTALKPLPHLSSLLLSHVTLPESGGGHIDAVAVCLSQLHLTALQLHDTDTLLGHPCLVPLLTELHTAKPVQAIPNLNAMQRLRVLETRQYYVLDEQLEMLITGVCLLESVLALG